MNFHIIENRFVQCVVAFCGRYGRCSEQIILCHQDQQHGLCWPADGHGATDLQGMAELTSNTDWGAKESDGQVKELEWEIDNKFKEVLSKIWTGQPSEMQSAKVPFASSGLSWLKTDWIWYLYIPLNWRPRAICVRREPLSFSVFEMCDGNLASQYRRSQALHTTFVQADWCAWS